MKKKDTQNLLLLGAVGAAAFFLTRRKASAATASDATPEDAKPPEEDEEDEPEGDGGTDAPRPTGPVDPPRPTGPTGPSEPPEPEPEALIDAPPLTSPAMAEAESTDRGRDLAIEANSIALASEDMGDDFAGPPPESDPNYTATPAQVAAVRAAFDVPDDRSVGSFLTDLAYFATVGEIIMPRASRRGEGWGPFMQIWNSTYDTVTERLIRGLDG